MIYRPLGQTGLDISAIGLGTVKIGRNQGVNYPQAFDLPDDLTIAPGVQAPFLSSGQPGGRFARSSQTYTLENIGGASLNWTAAVDVPWLDLSAAAGSLAPAGTTTVDAVAGVSAA